MEEEVSNPNEHFISINNETRIETLKEQLKQVHTAAVKHRERGGLRSKRATLLRTTVHLLDVLSLCSLATLFSDMEETKMASIF